ncbi:MAG TPA: isochorismatase family protein [Burkholderiales bacterium]|nr:isochorismatase family protein [Burkholderiales bacterium]
MTHCWDDVISAEAREMYRAYEREHRVGERPAVLAIDLYNLVYEREHPSSCGEFAWTALEPTRKLLAAARAARIPVIYSTRDPDMRVASTHRRRERLSKDCYEIKKEFAPEPDDIVVRKQRASVFFGTPLVAHLNQLGVRSLIVCGESTSGCVRASVVDAYSHGYHTIVVEECTFDRHLLSHKVNLFDMHHKYAGVMHLDEVLAQLRAA